MNILIVKLGAMGDVLRTTPLLTAYKKRYPTCKISWLVDPLYRDVVEGNPLIDHLVSFSPVNLHALMKSDFDIAINLDKEPEAIESITAVRSKKRIGFGRGVDGKLCALDSLSDYAYKLGFDDDLKFKKNQKTYQQISFEQAGLPYNGEEYIFPIGATHSAFAKGLLKGEGLDLDTNSNPVIGINAGAGDRFAGKKLPNQTAARLADLLTEKGATVLLLGGPKETEINKEIQSLCKSKVIHTGAHDIKRFGALVKECDLVISGDTTAMHIAIAVKTPVLAYFASTCAAEIELYNRGKKIISEISCAPCYKKICPIDEQCMKDLSAESLAEAASELL